MRRVLCGPFLPLRLLTCVQARSIHRSRIHRGDCNKDTGADEQITKGRLFHTLGFGSEEVGNLLQEIATGEQTSAASKERNPGQKPVSGIAEAFLREEMFAQILEELKTAHRRVTDEGPSGEQSVGVVSADHDHALHELVNRLGLQVEKHMHISAVDHLPAVRMQHAVLTLWGRTLVQSLNAFRRESNKRFKVCSATKDPEKIRDFYRWRGDVAEAYAKCFSSFVGSHRQLCAAVGKQNMEGHDGLNDLCTECLCSAAIISSTLCILSELRWHVSHCSGYLGAGSEQLVSLAQHTVEQGSHLLVDASALLEGTVLKGLQNVESCEQPVLLRGILLLVERTLSALDTPRGETCKYLVANMNAFYSMLVCLLFSLRSFSPDAPLQLESRCVTAVQGLWTRIAPPLERRTTDSRMTHRTIHATLNFRYLRCRADDYEEHDFLQFLSSRPDRALLVLRLLNGIVPLWVTRVRIAGPSPSSVVNSNAVWCRTLLEIEVELYFLACRRTSKNWTVPVDISSRKENSEQQPSSSEKVWEDVLVATSTTRIVVSSLIEAYIRAYVAEGLVASPAIYSKTRSTFTKHAASCFLRNTSTMFYPLLRRHYLDTDGKEVLVSCLQVFLLMKQLSDAMESVHDDRQSRKLPEAIRVCGIQLSQATEVAFFMSLSHHSKTIRPVGSCGGDALSLETVSTYVREVLFALDHNTTKQLRHLRTKKVLHSFTGVRCDVGEKVDNRLLRRQSQSVLSVVHAHVMHPSFLWMPLHQLQECFFMLSHERGLTKGLRNTEGTSETELQANVTMFDVGPDGASARHFSRGLGYLSLRLYVVTNVLRHYRLLLVEGSSQKEAVMPLKDSVAEANKRVRRQWARDMALLLYNKCGAISTESEGLNPTNPSDHERANRISLARLEATISLAVRNSLIFSVKKRRRLASLNATREHRDAEEEKCVVEDDTSADSAAQQVMTDEHEVSCEGPAASGVHLTLVRDNAEAPLGFSLHGSQPTVRRIVQGANAEDGITSAASSPTPFVSALRDVGISDPRTVVGWRITHVDGAGVADSKAIAPLIKGKRKFSLTLCPAEDAK